jgi:alanine-synthesizing transaminase
VTPQGALYCFPKLDPDVYAVDDDEEFVMDLLRAKKLLVTHGTGFNWVAPDHFRVVCLPDEELLEEAIGRIADHLATMR